MILFVACREKYALLFLSFMYSCPISHLIYHIHVLPHKHAEKQLEVHAFISI